MHYLNKYINLLIPIENDGQIYLRVTPIIDQFLKTFNEDKIPKSGYSYKEFSMPNGEPFNDKKYYPFLKTISYSFGVKIMWRFVLDPETLHQIKGIWIIGEENRVVLTHLFLEWFFEVLWNYHSWCCSNLHDEAKELRMGNVRTLASKSFMNALVIYMHDVERKLATPYTRSQWLVLEGYIKEQYKLDYKIYRPAQRREYYNAVSKKFFHKRMVS